MTDYYCDPSDTGSSDLGTLTEPYISIASFTQTARNPGDKCFIRGGTTQTFSSDLNFTSDGSTGLYIEIIGCNGSNYDPWSDGATSDPIWDFESGDYHPYMFGDEFWRFEHLKALSGTSRVWEVYDAQGSIFEDCYFDCLNGSNGVYVMRASGEVIFRRCEFINDGYYALQFLTVPFGFVEDCTFNQYSSSVATTCYGLNVGSVSNVLLVNCSFGETQAYDDGSIRFYPPGGRITTIGCTFADADGISFSSDSLGTLAKYEHYDGVLDSHFSERRCSNVIKDTSVYRSGGSDHSIRLQPTSIVGELYPACVGNQTCWPDAFAVWLEADVQKTITVYAKLSASWTTPPTASEVFLICRYFSSESDFTMTEVKSTETLSTDWTALTVTITPEKTGFARLDIHLTLYESTTDYIYIDPLPVVS